MLDSVISFVFLKGAAIRLSYLNNMLKEFKHSLLIFVLFWRNAISPSFPENIKLERPGNPSRPVLVEALIYTHRRRSKSFCLNGAIHFLLKKILDEAKFFLYCIYVWGGGSKNFRRGLSQPHLSFFDISHLCCQFWKEMFLKTILKVFWFLIFNSLALFHSIKSQRSVRIDPLMIKILSSDSHMILFFYIHIFTFHITETKPMLSIAKSILMLHLQISAINLVGYVIMLQELLYLTTKSTWKITTVWKI